GNVEGGEGPQRDDAHELHGLVVDEGEEDDDEQERDEDLAHAEARIHVVANPLALRTPVTLRQVPLIAGGETDSRLLPLGRELRSRLLRRGLAVVRDERADVLGLALLAGRGRPTLAAGARLGLRLAARRRVGVLARFRHYQSLESVSR